MESEVHSLGVVADTDCGRIALSIWVTVIPDGESDEAYNDRVALVDIVWPEAQH